MFPFPIHLGWGLRPDDQATLRSPCGSHPHGRSSLSPLEDGQVPGPSSVNLLRCGWLGISPVNAELITEDPMEQVQSVPPVVEIKFLSDDIQVGRGD